MASEVRKMEIELKSLPKFWWMLLEKAINDYVQFDEDNEHHRNAANWLFMEEQRIDVTSFPIVAEAYDINIDKFRFLLQRFRDKIDDEERRQKDPRGRRMGFLPEIKVQDLIDQAQNKMEMGYNVF